MQRNFNIDLTIAAIVYTSRLYTYGSISIDDFPELKDICRMFDILEFGKYIDASYFPMLISFLKDLKKSYEKETNKEVD